jgi:peptide/nickel transport system substrate-binding protein
MRPAGRLLAAGITLLGLGLALDGCARDARPACAECGSVVVAATGDPPAVLPPLVLETVGRDIGDLVFERLAYLAPGGAPIDERAFQPGLAASWERADSATWLFRLRPGARWHDGRPVTADDVVFSYGAYADSAIDALARGSVAGRLEASAVDSATVRVRLLQPSSEPLYDATYHVRILPRHIWGAIPTAAWREDTALAHLVGSGPYRLREWRRGASLTLVADTTAALQPAIRRVIWRFSPDPDAALNLLLAHDADLMESTGTPENAARVAADSALRAVPYPSAAYGFVAFNLAGRNAALREREVRRALARATDRAAIARSVFGPLTEAPSGPMSGLLWIRDSAIAVLPLDTVQARQSLAGRRVSLDILVPATSSSRRRIAQLLQESWRRRLGAAVTVTVVDFPVFQERLARGDFDAYIGAYLDEPSARGLAEQWTRAGWEELNYGHYGSAAFDSLFARAGQAPDVAAARARYREAMDTLNADAPAIFLYAPVQVAAVHRRLQGVAIDPYSWLSGLPTWRVDERWGERR